MIVDQQFDRLWKIIGHQSYSIFAREEIQKVWQSIARLESHSREFRSALELFNFSRGSNFLTNKKLSRNFSAAIHDFYSPVNDVLTREHDELLSQSMLYTSWMHIAAREGAMVIFHYFKRRENISQSIGSCVQLNKNKLRPYLKKSNEMLNRSFPSWMAIRHNVAHRVELEKVDFHRIKGPIKFGQATLGDAHGTMLISGSLAGNTYSATYNGKLHSYGISNDSLHVLISAQELLKEGVIAACSVD